MTRRPDPEDWCQGCVHVPTRRLRSAPESSTAAVCRFGASDGIGRWPWRQELPRGSSSVWMAKPSCTAGAVRTHGLTTSDQPLRTWTRPGSDRLRRAWQRSPPSPGSHPRLVSWRLARRSAGRVDHRQRGLTSNPQGVSGYRWEWTSVGCHRRLASTIHGSAHGTSSVMPNWSGRRRDHAAVPSDSSLHTAQCRPTALHL